MPTPVSVKETVTPSDGSTDLAKDLRGLDDQPPALRHGLDTRELPLSFAPAKGAQQAVQALHLYVAALPERFGLGRMECLKVFGEHDVWPGGQSGSKDRGVVCVHHHGQNSPNLLGCWPSEQLIFEGGQESQEMTALFGKVAVYYLVKLIHNHVAEEQIERTLFVELENLSGQVDRFMPVPREHDHGHQGPGIGEDRALSCAFCISRGIDHLSIPFLPDASPRLFDVPHHLLFCQPFGLGKREPAGCSTP